MENQDPNQKNGVIKLNSKVIVAVLIIIFVVPFLAYMFLGSMLFGWWNWGRSNNGDYGDVNSFEECIQEEDARLLEMYPEVCVLPDGKSFVNPDQKVEDFPQDLPVEDFDGGDL